MGLFRAYRWWHSKGTQNLAHFSSASVDTALDRIRHAANDDEYSPAESSFFSRQSPTIPCHLPGVERAVPGGQQAFRRSA